MRKKGIRKSQFGILNSEFPSPDAPIPIPRRVPPFTMFEFVASKSSGAFRANNVKSGTCVTDVA